MSGPRFVAAIVGGFVLIALLVGIGITVHRGQETLRPSQPLENVSPANWPSADSLIALALFAGITIAWTTPKSSWPLSNAKPHPWPPAERTAFIKSCVDKCRATPGLTPERYPVCDRACNCAADEGEKIMTVDELVAAYKSGTADQNEKLKRITQAGIACAK